MANDNLLEDPLFRLRVALDDVREATLPDVLAALSTMDTPTFPALMPHQAHAWRAFLAQLAAIALHHGAVTAPPMDAPAWRGLLRDLTSGASGDEPWRLVVDDLSQPAFMQPPVRDRSLARFKPATACPDEIDVLQTSTNHDVKTARMARARLEHWVYALVSVQTMQGFSGQSNYGISRMNSGFGSRPGVGVEVGVGWGARFRRDLKVLRELRKELLAGPHGFRRSDGFALLWLTPWDGTSALELRALDPFYIEVCRRVRLVRLGSGVAARLATSSMARIAARDIRGNTGDPWTPLQKAKQSALTVPESGLTYDLLRRVLFSSDFEPAPAQRIREEDPDEDLSVAVRVLVRGQGKTRGFHHRQVPLPRGARSLLLTVDGRNRLARLAKVLVEDAGTAWKGALRPALAVLIRGGPKNVPRRVALPASWHRRFDSAVDDAFFPALWEAVRRSHGPDESVSWRPELAGIARKVLREAEGALRNRSATRFRALARATQVLEGQLRRRFPTLQHAVAAVKEVST